MTSDTKTVPVQITNRFTGAVIFEANVDASLDKNRRLGAAVLIAVKAGANLAGATLTGAYLADAYLMGANLTGAYLAGAYLMGANLTGAYLMGANLTGAYLAGAYLMGANLTGANLTGAYLADAECLFDIGSPDGYRFAAVKHDGRVMIAVGCRWFTFAGAVAHWKDRPDRAKSRAALEYLRALCAIEGWQLGEEG